MLKFTDRGSFDSRDIPLFNLIIAVDLRRDSIINRVAATTVGPNVWKCLLVSSSLL